MRCPARLGFVAMLAALVLAAPGCEAKVERAGKSFRALRIGPTPRARRPVPRGSYGGAAGTLLDHFFKRLWSECTKTELRKEETRVQDWCEQHAGDYGPNGYERCKDDELGGVEQRIDLLCEDKVVDYRISAEEIDAFELPFKSKRLVATMLMLAALDYDADLPSLVTPTAKWGLPDRREIHGRPILGADGGEAFFDALRQAASRFGEKAVCNCPAMLPGPQRMVRNGAEPMWCFYRGKDGLDLLVFKLVLWQGRARIDYVGLFEHHPKAPVVVEALDAPPPMTPPRLK